MSTNAGEVKSQTAPLRKQCEERNGYNFQFRGARAPPLCYSTRNAN
jgi:hypothetical protein